MVDIKTPPTHPLGQERLNSVWSFTEKVKGSKIVQLVFFCKWPKLWAIASVRNCTVYQLSPWGFWCAMKILGAVWPLEKEFLQLRETGMSHFPCSQRGFQNLIFSHSFFLGLCRTKALAIHRIAILLFSPTLLCVNSTEIPFVSDHLARTENGWRKRNRRIDSGCF